MGRDYKDEYKKFQSSPKQIAKRAKLNKYNRDKGTYGNGDGKDASHGKDGEIKGFVDSSTNKGKNEKSRLKGSNRKPFAKHGGKMKGKPHSKGGIDINVEGGEYVIKKDSVNASTEPYLEYINQHGKLPTSTDARKRRKNAKR